MSTTEPAIPTLATPAQPPSFTQLLLTSLSTQRNEALDKLAQAEAGNIGMAQQLQQAHQRIADLQAQVDAVKVQPAAT